MKQWFPYLLLVVLMLQMACDSTKKAASNEKPSDEKPFIQYNPEQPHILFFNLTIRKADQEKNKAVELVNTKVVEGKIKRDFPPSVSPRPFQLLCSFLDKEEKILKQTAIDHPLYKRYEYQNDQGELSSKLVESDDGQFSLRTQLTEGMHYLKIEETLKDNQPNTLQIIPL